MVKKQKAINWEKWGVIVAVVLFAVSYSVQKPLSINTTGDQSPVFTESATVVSSFNTINIDIEMEGLEPILEYEIKSPSKKQIDGLYRTDFYVTAINIPIEKLGGGLRYHKGLACDIVTNEDVKNILTSRSETGGLMMSGFQITMSCTSEISVPVNHSGKLFTYMSIL